MKARIVGVRRINAARCLSPDEASYVLNHMKLRAQRADRIEAQTHAGRISCTARRDWLRWEYEFTLAGEPTLQVDLWRRLVGLAP